MQSIAPAQRAALRAAVLALAVAPAAAQFGAVTPLPGDLVIRPSAGNQDKPHVAAGAGHFLAVWEDDASSLVNTVFGQQAFGSSVPGNHDIHGMLLNANGQRLFDAPLVIDHEPWDQLNPRAAWNGSEYLVVFESTRPTSAFYSKGVYGVRVSATGQVLDAAPFAIYDSPGFDERLPTVASLGGTWLVAWLDQDPITQTAIISGRVVSGPGALAPKRTLIAGVSGTVPSELDLAAGAGRYALVYGVNYGSGVRARLFDAAAVATTSVLTLATTGHRTGVAASATGFYAAWLGTGGFRGTTLDASGVLGTPNGAVIASSGLSNNSSVQVGFDGATYTVAFDSIPSVYVVRVDGAGAVVGGPSLVTATPRWMDDIAVAGANGVTQVLWTDTRETPNNFGIDQNDVWHARIDANGNVTSTEALSVSPPAQFGARVAGDAATGFLMVYNSWSAGVSRIVAQRVDAEGRALAGEPFEVVSADRTLYAHDVAWNGSEFLVTWGRVRSLVFGGTPPLVEARRCRIDGTFLDAAPVPVMEGDTTAVDAVGRTFLITAHYHHPSFQSNHVVRHRRMDGATGSFLDPVPVIVVYAQHHDVVGLGDHWFVMWGGTAGLAGVTIDSSGAPGAAPTFYGLGHSFRLARNPARTEVLVVYEWQDQSGVHITKNIRMQRIAADGTALDPPLGPFVSSAPNAQLRPVGVSLGDEYAAVWADHRAHPVIEPGLGDVYACRLDGNAVQLDPQGIPLLATANAEGSVELFASGPGQAIFAASALVRTGPHAGVHRIRTGGYHGGVVGSVSCTQPAPNSTGAAGVLAVYGSTSALDRSLQLTASQLPQNALAFFLVSRTQGSVVPPGSQGVLCVAGQVGRYVGPGQVKNSGAAGAIALTVDPSATPTPSGFVAVLAGETWTFQAWHRDAIQGVATSNFSSAVAVTFR